MKKRAKQKLPSRRKQHVEREAEAGLSGALAGAAVGAVAGPPGAVAGAIIGGAVGVLAGAALDNQAIDARTRDAKLDAEIGVTDGDLGAPNLAHPPAKVGAYSSAASGGGGGIDVPIASGPMQPPDS